MKIETQIESKDFIKFTFKLIYRKLFFKALMIFGIFAIITSIPQFFMEHSFASDPYAELFVGLFIVFILPVFIYFNAKKNYETNKTLQEKVNYEFLEEKILISGESFNSEISWDKIYRIEESEEWILIFQNRQTANIILKSCIGENLNPLKTLISSKNVKTKFKKK